MRIIQAERKRVSPPAKNNNAVTLRCRKGKSLVFHTRLNHKNVLRIKLFTWRKIANRKKKKREEKNQLYDDYTVFENAYLQTAGDCGKHIHYYFPFPRLTTMYFLPWGS